MSQTPVYHMFVGVDIAAKTFTATWGPCNTAPVRPTVFAQNSFVRRRGSHLLFTYTTVSAAYISADH